MARSVSVAHILYEHIGWEEDCLTTTIGKTKGDQEEKNTFPRHIYAINEKGVLHSFSGILVKTDLANG